jgi:hypothetical protein
MNRFKKNDMAIEFYIFEMKHTPQEGVRSIRKKSWFNFQTIDMGSDFKSQLSKHKTSLKKNLTDPPSGLGVSF